MNFLVEPKKGTKWPLNLPRFESRQAAIDVCKDLCKYQFMHRSEKRGKGDLVVSSLRFVLLQSCPIEYGRIVDVLTVGLIHPCIHHPLTGFSSARLRRGWLLHVDVRR